MSDDSSTIESGLDAITEQALRYAGAGMAIFPVHCDSKAPMPGYGWAMLATSKSTDVIIDFTNAIVTWGHDNVSIAWALGQDGCLAVDLDTPNEPGWVAEIEPDAMVNKTKRGRHLYFKNPPGVVPGNGTSHFPTQGGFDVRGAGGYVVIAGPDRPGFDPGQLVHARPYPIPDHLTPYGGSTTSATKQEVKDFAAQHTASKGDQYLNWLRTALVEQWQPGNAGDPRTGRHPLACEWMAKVAEESQLGLYPFRAGATLVMEWFKTVKPDADPREWPGILSWAVGRALSKQSPATDDINESESLVPLDDDGITVDESFLPLDLDDVLSGRYLAPQPSILKRDDRQALLYRGQINGVHGDSGLGKGWVALYAAAEQLLAGNTVMMLDLEDVPSSIIGRLRLLNVHDQAIRERFIYIRPHASFDRLAVEHLVSIVASRHPSLVIIDSLGEAFGLEGIDENHDSEVGPWLRRVPRRLADEGNGEDGPAVLIVDHVTKLNDNPLHPSGSKRKRAAVGGAQYWLQAPDPLSADKGGRLRLICAKDRHGTYAHKEHVADLVIRIDPAVWEARLYSPLPTDDTVTARLTRAVNKAVSTLAEHGKPASRNALALMMGGRKADSLEAIKLAIEAGAVAVDNDDRHLVLPSWGQLSTGAVEEPFDQD